MRDTHDDIVGVTMSRNQIIDEGGETPANFVEAFATIQSRVKLTFLQPTLCNVIVYTPCFIITAPFNDAPIWLAQSVRNDRCEV